MLEVRIEIRRTVSSCAEALGGFLALEDVVVDDAVGKLDGSFDDPPVSAGRSRGTRRPIGPGSRQVVAFRTIVSHLSLSILSGAPAVQG
jgi:hypothetical protein